MKIGFIGLGNMGSGMAKNLAAAGFDVAAFDLSSAALEQAKANGCVPCDSIEQAIMDQDVIITMLPAGKHVASVYQDSVFAHASTSTLLMDCSTIDVATAKSLAQQAAQAGFSALDAPVSGGTKAAQAGTLTFMVGGEKHAFEQGLGALNAMGQKIVHTGQSGTGQAAKACNNMLLGATMIATCEAFNLAKQLGLDPSVFYDVASAASGQSWSMTSYCPVKGVGPQSPADNDFQGGFAAALMLKDLKLAQTGAEQSHTAIPMGERAAQLYQQFCNAGFEGMDFSGIIDYLDQAPKSS